MISWFSRKQSCVALSIAEVEYVATCLASCELVWLRKLLSDLFDLQTCVKLSENLMFHEKSNNIEIKYHYTRDMVERGPVKL